MRFLVVIIFIVFSAGCRKKDGPSSPEQAKLIYPENNSECTSGITLSDSSSEIEFRWQQANNTTQYKLSVTNTATGVTQIISTRETSVKLPLAKGDPYSWLVTTLNNSVDKEISSRTWHFYNAGSRTFYAPFPVTVVRPLGAAKVFKDINNDVELFWESTDLDNDVEGFQLYFGLNNPPENLRANLPATSTSYKVNVVSGNTYYWKVVTTDEQGNVSDSGVYSFSVL